MEPTSSSTEEAIIEAALSETPMRSQASANACNVILVFFFFFFFVGSLGLVDISKDDDEDPPLPSELLISSEDVREVVPEQILLAY